ncbi:MAG TPA: hypothetical protein VL306_00850, partial [Methylomirabilota bacterium]|nr:hypothetical protein [Methylomirabilota bacterium]
MTDLRPHGIPPVDVEKSLEKREELAVMKNRIEAAMHTPEIQQKVTKDFEYTFRQLGLPLENASEISNNVIKQLVGPGSLEEIEPAILSQFKEIKVGEKNLIEVLH